MSKSKTSPDTAASTLPLTRKATSKSTTTTRWGPMTKATIITAVATVAAALATFAAALAAFFSWSTANSQYELTKLIEKPKANLDFICPKLDENGVGVTDVTFYNDGKSLGLFTIRIHPRNMSLTMPPYFNNLIEDITDNTSGCVKAFNGTNKVVTNVFIGPEKNKTYPMTVKLLGNSGSFSVEMKCQSELCIGYSSDKSSCDIKKSDEVVKLSCVYPKANEMQVPPLETYKPEPNNATMAGFCDRNC